MKSTAVAPSNIAFIKYWGRKNEKLRLPTNGSISMDLSDLVTTTTVEFSSDLEEDIVIINKQTLGNEKEKVVNHLDRVRKLANINQKAKVVSENNFPTGTGLSSSSSGFAALTVACVNAAGLKLSEKELSILARQGSGSACRSIPDGFVEWLDGDTSKTSYAVSLYPPDYWNIVDVVAIVSTGQKDVSTSEGQKSAFSSPFYSVRLERIKDKLQELKHAIKTKDFTKFGEITEVEALELHAIMLTSNPSLIYWTPGTLELMKCVKKWRAEGLEVYFTVNTGQNIHLLAQKRDLENLQRKLKEVKEVLNTIINYPSKGAYIIQNHLFTNLPKV